MTKRSDQPLGVDRRRFSFKYAGEMWMSDVMHGPKVGAGRQRHKTYLIAFIDDATRVIPYAAFARGENTAAFLPVFKQALIRRGLPHRLFVDNGANYRSQHLALVLRQARHRADSRTPLSARRKGQNRTLVPPPYAASS